MYDIVTVTLNPTFDLTLYLSEIVEDDVNRVERETRQASGKGINVSRVLKSFGFRTLTCGLGGSDNLEEFVTLLGDQVDEIMMVPVTGHIRENITVQLRDRTVKINRDGASCTKDDIDFLCNRIIDQLEMDGIVVVSGSLPLGCKVEWLVEFCMRIQSAKNAKIALDCEAADQSVLRAINPWLIKPNIHEWNALFGNTSGDISQGDVPHYLKQMDTLLEDTGIENIVFTLGEDGIILTSSNETWRALSPMVEVKSTVGAGDSAMAGFIVGYLDGENVETIARMAAAFGTATVMCDGSSLVTRDTLNQMLPIIHIERM